MGLVLMVSSALTLDVGVGGEDRLQPLGRRPGAGGRCGQLGEMLADLTLMPGGEDALDVREVLVEGGAPYPGPLSDLGHGHFPQAMFSHQGGGGVDRCLSHRPAVFFDGLFPQLRHPVSIHHAL
jgi:hypothetical protein